MGLLQTSIYYFFILIEYLIFARIIVSFFIRNPYNKVYKILHEVTEPILAPFRNLIYKLGIDTGMFDLSPLLAIVSLRILAELVHRFFWMI